MFLRSFPLLFLVLGDIFLIYLSLFLALVARHGNLDFLGGAEFNALLYHFSFLAPAWLLLLMIFDFYEAKPFKNRDFGRNTIVFAAGLLASGAFYFYFRPQVDIAPRTILLLYTATLVFLILVWRYIAEFIFGQRDDGGAGRKTVSPEDLDEDSFIRLFGRKNSVYEFLKRIIDVLSGLIGLVLLAVFFPTIGLLTKLTSPGPLFYSQTRIGKGDRIFVLYKFRTMVPDAEKEGPRWAEEKDERVIKIGYVLRRLHLDELPQAVNLLKGDLSLVGPRPERPEFTALLEKEIPHYHLRHLVKPGVLGWAQLNYSYGDSVEDAREKLKYDLYYIQKRSFLMDALIILKSIKIVLFARGQ